MKPQTAILKLRTRLNKLHSSDYDNIPDWTAVEAINKAALEVTRNTIHGNNKQQEGDEETIFRIDDLQFLLKPVSLTGTNTNPKIFEAKLPTDYLWYKRVIPIASKGDCKDQIMDSKLREEANVPELLNDWSNQPDWDWRQTFHTILNNKIRVYTDGKFFVESLDTVYYRKPKQMDISGYVHEDGRDSIDADLEFKDDLAEVIIDYAAGVISGDVESVNQTQINNQRSQNNI
jgi:hypothetical protein